MGGNVNIKAVHAAQKRGYICVKKHQNYSRKTPDILYKEIVRSVIYYALSIYANTIKQTELDLELGPS
jgi:hypothetical protein